MAILSILFDVASSLYLAVDNLFCQSLVVFWVIYTDVGVIELYPWDKVTIGPSYFVIFPSSLPLISDSFLRLFVCLFVCYLFERERRHEWGTEAEGEGEADSLPTREPKWDPRTQRS